MFKEHPQKTTCTFFCIVNNITVLRKTHNGNENFSKNTKKIQKIHQKFTKFPLKLIFFLGYFLFIYQVNVKMSKKLFKKQGYFTPNRADRTFYPNVY